MKLLRVLPLLLLLACSEEPTLRQDPEVLAQLTIEVTNEEGGTPEAATLTCGELSSGTGYLGERGSAQRACETVLDPENQKLLTEGPPRDRICTEIYGGPDVALVEGSIRGEGVDARFTRTNGCEISDWERLEPLLGAPGAGEEPSRVEPSPAPSY